MSTPIKLKDPGSQGRTYTYSFTFGGLATLVASMALALTLFFVLGVLVGRGHRPEAALPPVAVADCVGHTHIDVAWLWDLYQTRHKAARSFSA